MPRTNGYAEIAAHFRQQIQDGTLQPGDVMPSFKETSAQFGVAITTVNRAYQALRREGLTVAKTGVGTVVADPTSTPIDESGGREETLSSGPEAMTRALTLVAKAEFLAAAGNYEGAAAYAVISQAYTAIATAWGDVEPKAGAEKGDDRCPDHPGRYRVGCVDCALAVPS